MDWKLDSRHPIGLFDSGVGGFTVLKELKHILPNEQFIYFGDTRNLPYGDKSPEIIHNWATNSIKFLLRLKVKAIVVACNISSSVLTKEELTAIPVPVFTLIEYGAKRAVEVTRLKKVGVLATMATVQTRSYERVLSSLDNGIEVVQSACPKFVPMIESGKLATKEIEATVREYLTPITESGADAIIYGCSHYPLLSRVIEKYVNGAVLIDPAVEVAKAVKEKLSEIPALRTDPPHPDVFFVSKITENFLSTAKTFLGQDISGHTLEWIVNE